jgi:hypothetical protein
VRSVQSKQTLKLRLLALVLALALAWYSGNPVPRPIIRRKGDDEPHEEKKRSLGPRSSLGTVLAAFGTTGEMAEPLPSSDEDEDEDDFQWPDFIDG